MARAIIAAAAAFALAAGTHNITAIFIGGPFFLASLGGTTAIIKPAPLTLAANSVSRVYGAPNPAFTVGYSGFVLGEGPSVLGGTLSLGTSATAGSAPGGYAIYVGGMTSRNYGIIFKNGTLTVTPAPLSATGVSFSAIAGAPFSGTVATFINADPFGSAASYIAAITWGDGSTSAGVVSGAGGTLTVTGSHTYADPVNKSVSVQISHKLGFTQMATTHSTATVTSLGVGVRDDQTAGVGFWHAKKGQALIQSFNGGGSATALSTWLATNFANLYGAGAGSHNLSGMTDAQVAAVFNKLFDAHHDNADVEVLAAALNVYATTASLGGAQAKNYGFRVTTEGLGASFFNVRRRGAAFGVADGTRLNVYELLKAVNQRAVNGVLDNGNAHLQDLTEDLFERLNDAGQ